MDSTYLAVQDNGQKILRGSLNDLAIALRLSGAKVHDLFFGDWAPDTAILSKAEQLCLVELMMLPSFGNDTNTVEADI